MGYYKNLANEVIDFYDNVSDDLNRIADFFSMTTTQVKEIIENYHPAGVKNDKEI
ncbi:hypothetical protein UFOVP250_80 [uncultured Caudovirales phage]|uniref:Uncharacterized protein n=1 Tax=uncultured Caudovirales phage TaxID=2100421 RepID=A0A6J5LF95_9CAUD|nr:hypothetical protein UFOVP250_80 [uncultured Caudovirales phage]